MSHCCHTSLRPAPKKLFVFDKYNLIIACELPLYEITYTCLSLSENMWHKNEYFEIYLQNLTLSFFSLVLFITLHTHCDHYLVLWLVGVSLTTLPLPFVIPKHDFSDSIVYLWKALVRFEWSVWRTQQHFA